MAFQFPQFGGTDSGSYTPETLARKQKLAEALLGKSMGIQNIEHPLQGLAQMLQAGISGYRLNEANQTEAAERERANKALGELLGQGMDADLGQLMQASSDPWASDANSRLAQVLMGESIRRSDPAYQMELEKMGLELDALRNPGAAAPEYDFTFGPNGELIRTDATSGGFESLGNFGKEPEPGFRILTPEEAQASGLPAGGAYQAGPDGRVYEIGGGGTEVNVNTGDGAPGLGKLSTDYGYVLDPATGQPKIDPTTGLPTAAAVPGSPAALEQARLAAAAEAGGAQTERYGNVVTEDIDRAVELLKADPLFSTGPFGQVLGNISGTSANRLDSMLSTIRANTSFDRLQAMRAASPTGGALGAVSDTELRLLQNSIGALERSNPDDLEYNLRRVQKIYDEIINGPQAEVQNAANKPGDAPKFSSQAEYDAAPSGTVFVAPDGSLRRKP